jgi:hypothetical protein
MNRIRQMMRVAANGLDLRDCLTLTGLGLLSTGIAVIYWPAALIVSGLLLLGLALGPILLTLAQTKRRGE